MAVYMLVYIYMNHPGYADGTREIINDKMTEIECKQEASRRNKLRVNAPREAQSDRLVCEKKR